MKKEKEMTNEEALGLLENLETPDLLKIQEKVNSILKMRLLQKECVGRLDKLVSPDLSVDIRSIGVPRAEWLLEGTKTKKMSVYELLNLSKYQLLKMRNIGPNTVRGIRRCLLDYGIEPRQIMF